MEQLGFFRKKRDRSIFTIGDRYQPISRCESGTEVTAPLQPDQPTKPIPLVSSSGPPGLHSNTGCADRRALCSLATLTTSSNRVTTSSRLRGRSGLHLLPGNTSRTQTGVRQPDLFVQFDDDEYPRYGEEIQRRLGHRIDVHGRGRPRRRTRGQCLSHFPKIDLPRVHKNRSVPGSQRMRLSRLF